MVVRISSDSTCTVGLDEEAALTCTAVADGKLGVGISEELHSSFRRLRVAVIGLVKCSEHINSVVG